MSTSQKGRIFISYRRTDSAGYAGRIFDRLSAHFGAEAIFMDVDTIEAGVDFVEVLQNAVRSCDVLVALIGRQLLNTADESGKRRLDNPEDFVRIEIAAALSRGIRVIPVLVDGALMPHSTELPENLQALARRNALQVSHHSFNADVNRLIAQLELALRAAEEKKKQEIVENVAREKEERARLSAAKQAERERKERERLDAEEKARKDKEERDRQAPPAPHVGRTVSPTYEQPEPPVGRAFSPTGTKTTKPAWLPYGIGGGAILAIAILFGIGALIRNVFYSASSPTEAPVTVELSDIATSAPTDTVQELGVGSTMISEKDGMVMVYVPAGEFQMGSDADQALAECQKYRSDCQRDWFINEEPVHTVYVDAFWIDQTEVTNAMYSKCVQAGECDPPSSAKSHTRDIYYGNPEFDDYPVIYVSWNNAVAYCTWAGRRLPTEAEWEKAAGWDETAQAQRVYPWGNTIDESYANYNQKVGDTTIVGSYEKGASFYGAYDMAGNVLEWVSDWYDVYPGGDKNASRDFGQTFRVLRGGAWDDDGSDVSSASRLLDDPSDAYLYIGFRCSRSAASP